MKIETNLHTILLLIGPSNCGKSTLAKKIKDSNYSEDVTLLSSDENRRLLLGQNLHKHDPSMMHVSEQSFNMLFSDLRNYTSYPVNKGIVIVDTTGLNEDFRDKVIEVAKDNHYNIEAIIFDYKDHNDYYKFMTELDNKQVISKHVKKLKQETLPRVSLKKFNKIHKVKSPDEIDTLEFIISDKNLFNNKYKLPQMIHTFLNGYLPVEYEIVGDVHNSLTALKELILKDERFEINNESVQLKQRLLLPLSFIKYYILLGDWIDKGSEGIELINFIYKNKGNFLLVKGNHENFVYKYLKGTLTELPSQDIIDNYFTSIKDLQVNEDIRNKFFELVEQSKDFYIHKNFIVTHSPCKRKYLGKLDPQSLRNMRSFVMPKRVDFPALKDYEIELEKQLEFIQKESAVNQPVHIFGHVAFKNRLIYKNKIGIDTGAGDNNILSSVIINGFQVKPFIKQVKIGENNELPTIFKPKEAVQLIDPLVLKRVKGFANKKINYISGTMSPSDKDTEQNVLESLAQGLKYFKDNEVNEVVLQPKYMGSRCQVYLFNDIEKCYAVSRNGYRINHVDLTNVFTKMINKYFAFENTFSTNTELLIFDGELMPWYALGKGLIEEQYGVIQQALIAENLFLKENGFDTKLNELSNQSEKLQFTENFKLGITKKDLIEKYGHSKYETYANFILNEKQFLTEDEREQFFNNYDLQVSLYGKDTEVEYKPFSLLKVVYKDGTELLNPNDTAYQDFQTVSEDLCKLIYLNEPNYLERAQNFFDKMVTEKQMEGIVIKPSIFKESVAPYMKVRNSKYLTLTYGYDYTHPSKYDKLIRQKNISRKLRMSIKEHKLAMEMLAIPYKDISGENNDYLNLVVNITEEIAREKELDPRL